MNIVTNILRKLKRKIFHEKAFDMGAHSVMHKEAKVINLQNNRSAVIIGFSTHICGELLVFPHGGKIEIGSECYIGEGTRIWSGQHIKIGDRVLIAHNVNIFDNQTHSLSAQERNSHFRRIYSAGHPSDIHLGECPVIIEDDAWIACMSIILRGVHIGRGAVVAAGSVVTKDVPAWTVVAGNPARFVKSIPEEQR